MFNHHYRNSSSATWRAHVGDYYSFSNKNGFSSIAMRIAMQKNIEERRKRLFVCLSHGYRVWFMFVLDRGGLAAVQGSAICVQHQLQHHTDPGRWGLRRHRSPQRARSFAKPSLRQVGLCPGTAWLFDSAFPLRSENTKCRRNRTPTIV